MSEQREHTAESDACPTCLLVREEPDEPIQPGDYYTVNPASPTRCPSCGLVPGRGSEGARRVAAARATPPAEVWECGPHANAWNGHDARCRRITSPGST